MRAKGGMNMRLTPKETEKLMLCMAGRLAADRRERGLKLNYPEAVAYISSELLELARDGFSVAELMSRGRRLLSPEDVMDGVAEDDIGDTGGGHISRRYEGW